MAGLKFQCWHHMWVECVVSFLPCSKRFFSRNWGFPLSSKTNISKVQFNKEGWRVDKEPHYVDVQPLNLLYLYLFSICAFFSCESVKQWWICSGGAVGGGGGGGLGFHLICRPIWGPHSHKKLCLSLGPLLLSWFGRVGPSLAWWPTLKQGLFE